MFSFLPAIFSEFCASERFSSVVVGARRLPGPAARPVRLPRLPSGRAPLGPLLWAPSGLRPPTLRKPSALPLRHCIPVPALTRRWPSNWPGLPPCPIGPPAPPVPALRSAPVSVSGPLSLRKKCSVSWRVRTPPTADLINWALPTLAPRRLVVFLQCGCPGRWHSPCKKINRCLFPPNKKTMRKQHRTLQQANDKAKMKFTSQLHFVDFLSCERSEKLAD